MRSLISLCFIISSFSLYSQTKLEQIYGNEKTLTTNNENFVKQNPEFTWNGTNHRIAVSKTSQLFENNVRESIAYFSAKGKLVRLDAWLYNKGDDGPLTEANFTAKYKALIKQLSEHFKVEVKKSGMDGATRSTAYIFPINRDFEVRLLVGYSGKGKSFESEYINLLIRNYAPSDKVKDTKGSTAYVKKEANGDVFINSIPMIDQGPKGYCVPATIARIGQHYGADISMHEIAMIAQTDGGGGTSPRLAMNAVKKYRSRICLGVKIVKVKYKHRAYDTPSSKILELHSTLDDKDRDFLKFKKEIITRIDKGRLIAWSMMVGAFKETGIRASQNLGGHMRMIIGYNKTTDEIIYSDSWNRKEGDGHEFKKWTFKQAYVVTSSLYDVTP